MSRINSCSVKLSMIFFYKLGARSVYGQININSMHAGYFFMLLLSSADSFQNELFQKILSGRNTVRVSNRLDPNQD